VELVAHVNIEVKKCFLDVIKTSSKWLAESRSLNAFAAVSDGEE
jgi:hypothetical protein